MSEESKGAKRPRTEEASGNNPSEEPPKKLAADPSPSNKLTRREKEALILQELSSTMHTLQHLSNVLEDVVSMTSKPAPEDFKKEQKNIIKKQQALLKELRQWQELIPPNDGQRA